MSKPRTSGETPRSVCVISTEVNCCIAYLQGDKSPLLLAAPRPQRRPPGQTGTATPCSNTAFDPVHQVSDLYKLRFATVFGSAASIVCLSNFLVALRNSTHFRSICAEQSYPSTQGIVEVLRKHNSLAVDRPAFSLASVEHLNSRDVDVVIKDHHTLCRQNTSYRCLAFS